MTQQSDLDAKTIALVGGLGIIVTLVVTLIAIVSYFSVAKRVAEERSVEAAQRIHRQTEEIAEGTAISQPWLNPNLQRATQEKQLSLYAKRTITGEDGSQKTTYAIPIKQAMESVLQEAKRNVTQTSPPQEGES